MIWVFRAIRAENSVGKPSASSNAFRITSYNVCYTKLLRIWLYTYKGGIKTIIWTDTLQTIFLFTALTATIVIIAGKLNFSFIDTVSSIVASPMSKMFEFSDWHSSQNFFKQFISGALITIVMTGLV